MQRIEPPEPIDRTAQGFTVTEIGHVIEIGTTLTRSWFRGHGQAVNALTPRIFREEFELRRAMRPSLELDLIEGFKDNAALLTAGPLPAADDHLEWLCLMQHYRMPTRLLDWTESILVALHFAVEADENRDGELWGLWPNALNLKSHVGYHLPRIGVNPVLSYLVDEAFWPGDSADHAKQKGLNVVPNRPVAFMPRRHTRRMLAQLSTFTLHPPPSHDNEIVDLLPDARDLVRYTIPSRAKRQLRSGLRALGVTDVSIFSDLEGLSRELVEDSRVLAYDPPTPPTFPPPHDDPASI
jgi:hypothetical protein